MPFAVAPWDTPENAAAYARFCRSHGVRQRAAEDLASFAWVRHETRLADLGCGTGVSTRVLARFAPSARVVGVDPATAMLAAARRHTRSNRVSYVAGDSSALPSLAREQPFEVVTCVSALWLSDDLDETLGHVFRALAPGGRLAFSLPAELVGDVDHLLEEDAAHFFATLAAARRDEGLPDPLPVQPRTPLTVEGWERALRTAGFSEVESQVRAYLMAADEALAHLAIPAVADSYLPGATPAQVKRVLARVGAVCCDDARVLMERRWRNVVAVRP
jgi:SAM-dependent methyltransferase